MESSKKEQANKRGKVSKFHLGVIEANIDKILEEKLIAKDIMAIINEEARKAGEPQILDPKNVRRIVRQVMSTQPQKAEEYENIIRYNRGKRNIERVPYQETEIGRTIIQDYLPKIIAGEITFDIIEQELKTCRKTVNKIIEEHYLTSGDEDGLKMFKKAKKRNKANSVEKRKKADEMRKEVAKYKVVSDSKFLTLSEEEQDEQIIMKIRLGKLQEENRRKGKDGIDILITENSAKVAIEKVKEYFISKNDKKNNIVNFSEEEIRYIIFRYPTIIGRDAQTLEEKLNVLLSYEDIDEQTAYNMIKSFPSLMGYSSERTRAQLDLLQNEKLIHYAINRPSALMRSVGLTYALIELAKERYETNDLSKLKTNKIFLKNEAVKRLYGIGYNELKQRFPYAGENEKDEIYTVDGQDIGKVTFEVKVEQVDKANDVIQKAINEKSKDDH